MTKDDVINAGIERLSMLTGEDFHGYRSEIWGVLATAYDEGAAAARLDEIERKEEFARRLMGELKNG